ncbi:hypothetical protein Bp8pS_180 [Bacillus phage vB_BpuM-BpSp]|nr:hypothetical protein Bp8pS_180 [Bacillus phage vB_BpuM-BpSp]
MKNLKKDYVLVYEDNGDQEVRLTSIVGASLVEIKDGFSVENFIGFTEREEVINSLKEESFSSILNRKKELYEEFGIKKTEILGKVITISNDFSDSDNLDREELIDGKNENDIIHQFEFLNINNELNVVFLSSYDLTEFGTPVILGYITRKSQEDILEELRSIKINNVVKRGRMSYNQDFNDNDGNMYIFEKYLDDSNNYIKAKYVLLQTFLSEPLVEVSKKDE